MKTIYLDMDGVVADFDAIVVPIIGYRNPGQRYPDSDWAKLKHYSRLYQSLPVCNGAQDFVLAVSELAKHHKYNLRFLTAVPQDNDFPYAFQDKISWVNRHFGNIPVFFGPYSTDKKYHARSGDILIDDRDSNIEEWNSLCHDAIAIHHRGDLTETYKRLKELLHETR